MAANRQRPAGRVRIGTSGYVYAHWRERFYPKGLPAREWLGFYARHFDAVELNGTFYRLPSERAAEGWASGTPADFVFAVKASRFLTHVKRLTDTGRGLARFFEAIAPLSAKVGPILWQLPPTMKPDLARLSDFLDALPQDLRHAIEFRGEAWYRDEVFALLDDKRAALCLHDRVEAAAPFPPPGPFAYRRFHGTTAGAAGLYGSARLRRAAAEMEALARDGRDCYAFFNNDAGGAAVRDAFSLAERVAQAIARRGAAAASGPALDHRGE